VELTLTYNFCWLSNDSITETYGFSGENRFKYFVEFIMKKIIIFICLNLIFSFYSYANKSNDYIIFIKHSTNDSDYYSSVGVELIHRELNSNLGFSLNSSIGHAQVTDTFDYQNDFIAWEAGIKIGYFSDISLYAEFGVDLLELAFNDRSDDDYSDNKNTYNTGFENDNFDHRHTNNNIDGYVGFGSSILLEQIKATAFVRYREISGYDWQAKNHTFSGIELAIVF
jgi:hypothetical protein